MMLAMAGTDVVPLFAAAHSGTTTNGPPTGAPAAAGYGAAGVGAIVNRTTIGTRRLYDWSVVLRFAGTGAISGIARLWIYHAGLVVPAAPTVDLHAWAPAGKGVMADRGKLNDNGSGSVAISGTDAVTHAEPFGNLGPIDGAYLELVSLSGTAFTAVAMLVGAPVVAR